MTDPLHVHEIQSQTVPLSDLVMSQATKATWEKEEGHGKETVSVEDKIALMAISYCTKSVDSDLGDTR